MTEDHSPQQAAPGADRGGNGRNRGYWMAPSSEPAPQAPEAGPPVVRSARENTRTSRVRRKKSRRRRLVRLAVLLVVLAGIGTAVGLIVTGRTVVPVVSEQVFPIRYSDEIGRVADEYGLDPYLVAAVAKTESSFDPEAVSPVGAVGLMQLMPATAQWITGLGIWRGADEPVLTDPADNLELGACYLAYLFEKYDGGQRAALAAYNAGPGNVDEWIEEAGGREEFGLADIPFKETRDFVRRVERYRFLYERVHPDVFVRQGGIAGRVPLGAA